MNIVSTEEQHQCHDDCHVHHPTIFAKMIHFFKWWLAFAGLISATTVCPFCGAIGVL
ncbi:MAG: hypothetical protein HQK76_17645 [Desulfobacterales bacterium]|nr:hypothetical protein [Desulfobacterales bacterium]